MLNYILEHKKPRISEAFFMGQSYNATNKNLYNKCRGFCDRDRIQTCNRLIRSQLLYSVELRGHYLLFFCFNGCKDTDFF